MKYIRTRDGRILKGSNYGFGVGMPYKKYDVKIANTIEELCDEFVLVDTESGYCGILPKDKEIKFDKVNMGNAYGRKFYGAIWTDKGLIYVAKMSEKGDWKLL